MEWPLAALFLLSFTVEIWVTTNFFMQGARIRKHLGPGMRRWGYASLVLMSSVNLAGLHGVVEVMHGGAVLGLHNYVQAAFALSTLSLLGWVYVFHQSLWKGPNK